MKDPRFFRICKICGKEFTPKQQKQILCGEFDCKMALTRQHARKSMNERLAKKLSTQNGPGQEIERKEVV